MGLLCYLLIIIYISDVVNFAVGLTSNEIKLKKMLQKGDVFYFELSELLICEPCNRVPHILVTGSNLIMIRVCVYHLIYRILW